MHEHNELLCFVQKNSTSIMAKTFPVAEVQSHTMVDLKKALETHTFSKSAMNNLSLSDQIFFEYFGQGPIVKMPYQCVHYAFEEQVKKNPQAIAAYHLNESITYQELDRHANRLAEILVKNEVSNGDHVSLFLQRSIPMLVGILAILKVGASYVPRDARISPKEGLRHIIGVTSSKVILTLSNLRHFVPVPEGHTCLSIDEIMQEPFKNESEFLEPMIPREKINRNDTCFVLFTSGTTGEPNGVQVTHENVCNILHTKPGSLGMRPGLKVSQILSIAFDMAAWEILGCLSHGATLVIRGKDIQEAVKNVDIVIATPSILSLIDVEQCQNIKTAAVAGEPCPRPLADKWAEFCTFYNSCGPTETTIVNTMHHHYSDRLTIGKPTPNNTVYILDDERRPCAIGQIGEMWAGGKCVSSGYLNNPHLNKERYVPDPFLGNGHLMFRTRDLGRWTSDGELEHFGRTDDQVKIRGFRVELDSISSVLESVPSCNHAVTLKLDNRNLVAFVSPQSVNIELAKQAVSSNLPYYCGLSMMIPIDDFPVTSRGKIDKRTLIKMASELQGERKTTDLLGRV